MDTKYELDLLDTSSEVGYHLSSPKEEDANKYHELLAYADSVGVSKRKVDELMSSMDGRDVETEASDACEVVYETKGSEAFNKCRQEYISKAKKEDKKGFWNNLFTGIKNVADTAQTYVPQESVNQQNTSKEGGKPNYSESYMPLPDKKVKILGMDPLVFTLVAITTVLVGGVAIAKIATSKTVKK